MWFFFVNCHCLEHAVTSRGLAGRWIGNTQYKEFRADNGAKLCWFVDDLVVLGAGQNLGALSSELPELVPWDDAMPEVGSRMRELREVKEENLALKKRLCTI
jgi:hypothetical protein